MMEVCWCDCCFGWCCAAVARLFLLVIVFVLVLMCLLVGALPHLLGFAFGIVFALVFIVVLVVCSAYGSVRSGIQLAASIHDRGLV